MKIKNPRVSVVIPVYNSENFLVKCLISVLNQSYDNYEIIVVDNNSTDNTKEIIRDFERKNKKIKYVFESKKGRGAARNAGVNATQGEIILMTDSDCIVSKDWIKNLIKPIVCGGENAVMGFQYDLVNNYWTRNVQKADYEYYSGNINGDYISQVDTKNFAINANIIKKVMFDRFIPTGEDFDFYLRLKDLIKIRYVPEIKVGHYHKSSFKDVVELSFRRAYWTFKIYNKYKHNPGIKKEQSKSDVSIINLLLFSPWLISQFIKKSLGEAFFSIVYKLSWGLGLLWARLK